MRFYFITYLEGSKVCVVKRPDFEVANAVNEVLGAQHTLISVVLCP